MVARAFTGAVIACVALLLAPTDVSAQVRGAGGVTIFDELNCPGQANAPKVTSPFSIGVTGLKPFSTNALIYVTDKDAKPEVTYGPAVIPGVDANGTACMNVLSAPPGSWKVDVVEQGEGFTDSKVFTIEGPVLPTLPPTTAPPPTTLPPATTAPPPTTPTTAPTGSTTSTTAPPPTATTTATTTPTATTTATTTPPTFIPVPGVVRPFGLLPWTFERPPDPVSPPPPDPVSPPPAGGTVAGPASLPPTGGSTVLRFSAIALALGLGGLLLTTARHRDRHDSP